MSKLLTKGNTKLHKSISSWTLPASKEVCGRVCDGCYAIKAQRIYPNVLPSRDKKLGISKTAAFVPQMKHEIKTDRPKFVRIHDSGEFYSQDYVDKWDSITAEQVDTVFYAYTKRLKDMDFSKLQGRQNVVLINSLHSGKINYGKIEEKPNGMFLCPDHKGSAIRNIFPTGAICGDICTYCMTKTAEITGVFFVKH